MTAKDVKFFKSIQACRGVAAIFVVLYHLGAVFSLEKYFNNDIFYTPFIFGKSGVYFFFVLSGYIIYTSHCDDEVSSKKFYEYFKKRFLRVYPSYWLVFISAYLILIISRVSTGDREIGLALLLKALLLLPLDKSVVGGTGSPVLVVAWTLQYEILFYIAFGILKYIRLLGNHVGYLIVFMACIFGAINIPINFIFSPYIVLFVVGVFIGFFVRRGYVGEGLGVGCVVAGGVFFVVAAYLDISRFHYDDSLKVIFYGLIYSLIIYGLVSIELNGRVVGGSNIFQKIGASSYALYLIHFPLISLLAKFFGSMEIYNIYYIWICMLFCVIFCSVVAHYYYVYIEGGINRIIGRI